MTENRKWQGNTDGGNFGQKSLVFLLKILGLKPLYVVLACVVPFYMLFARKGYLSIYQYFRKRVGYSTWKSFGCTYKNHFLFGQMMFDRFAFFAGKKNVFDVEIEGNGHFQNLANSDKGFVIVGSHVGNFEIAGYLLAQKKKRINTLVFGGETATVQRNRSKILNSNNIQIIPVSDDMSHLFAASVALQRGEIVSMPADRVFGSSKSIECDFLNDKADFPLGAFALATNLEVEVVGVFCIKISAKKYKVIVKSLDAGHEAQDSKRQKIARLTKCYVAELEGIVKQYPLQWFNFYEFWKK